MHTFCRIAMPLLLLFSIGWMSAQAKTFVFPDLNFQCTTPEGWNCDHKIGDVVHAFDAASGKCFCLGVYKLHVTQTQTQHAENVLMARLQNKGYTFISRQSVVLRGVPFDALMFSQKLSNQTYLLDEYVGRHEGFIYQLELSRYDGSPSADAELKAILDSFDFIDRTAPASKPSPVPSTPAPPQMD
jgi:hypothetical protein